MRRIHPDEAIAAAVSIEDLALALEILLSGGYAVWEDGSLIEIRALVDRIRGLRIVVYPKEHAPPHFHVLADGMDASFAIHDCSLLRGEIDKARHRLVQYWFAAARPKLISAWNEARPSDCTVGPIESDVPSNKSLERSRDR